MWSPIGPTDVEPVTAIGATNIRNSSKRPADSAGLNEGGESTHRSERSGMQMSAYVPIAVGASDDLKENPIVIDGADNTDDETPVSLDGQVIPLSGFTSNARIQVQIDLVTLATVEVSVDTPWITLS